MADAEHYCRKTERQFKSRKQLYILIALRQGTTNLGTSDMPIHKNRFALLRHVVRLLQWQQDGFLLRCTATATSNAVVHPYCGWRPYCSCTSLLLWRKEDRNRSVPIHKNEFERLRHVVRLLQWQQDGIIQKAWRIFVCVFRDLGITSPDEIAALACFNYRRGQNGLPIKQMRKVS